MAYQNNYSDTETEIEKKSADMAIGRLTCASSELRKEIEAKWGKFDASEIAALTSNDDLIAQVSYKYGLDMPTAKAAVEEFAKGRLLRRFET